MEGEGKEERSQRGEGKGGEEEEDNCVYLSPPLLSANNNGLPLTCFAPFVSAGTTGTFARPDVGL